MEADINDFNVDSLESLDDPEEASARRQELKLDESARTLERSQE